MVFSYNQAYAPLTVPCKEQGDNVMRVCKMEMESETFLFFILPTRENYLPPNYRGNVFYRLYYIERGHQH